MRVFISSGDISADNINLTDKNNLHHLKDVLRVKVGESLEVMDDKGRIYQTKVAKILPHSLLLKIEKKEGAQVKNYAFTVACAMAKNAKIDDIIDKLTQLGVDRIIPMITKRVIVKINSKQQSLKRERWNKIARAAAEQSKGVAPIVELPAGFNEVISQGPSYDLKLIPALIDKRLSLKEILAHAAPKNILVLIGPEGDFTPEEVRLAREQGFIPVTLGAQVLRVDTAAISVASFIKFYYENR